MEFNLDGLVVDFPYPQIYPEQYAYMLELKRALDAKGHALLEMPTGTGKTVTLLSLVTSYQRANKAMGKLVYCTRTVPEMEKVLEELQHLERHRDEKRGRDRPHRLLAVGLSSRRNMCVHPTVSTESERESVDTRCRSLTASWVRQRAAGDGSEELCEFFENLEKQGTDAALKDGVFTLDELKELARERGWCPYFFARHAIEFADVVVYNYQYLLDPKIAGLISRRLQRECVVVFDEAHNIDNVCIEVMSINFREATLAACERNVGRLHAEIAKLKRVDADRLNREYRQLVSGLAAAGALPGGGLAADADEIRANPVLPEGMLNEAVPGNIRRAEHFVTFLQRLVRHVKGRLEQCARSGEVSVEKPQRFLAGLEVDAAIDKKPLKFASERLRSLLRTLEITNVQELQPLMLVAEFGTMCATFESGFSVLLEPADDRTPTLRDPVMQLCCLDASVAIKHVFERFQSVIITSGTLSPIDLYPKLLSFTPCVVRTLTMSLRRDCICPLVVCRAADQTPLSTRFETRSEPATVQAYGELLVSMAALVPDGVVAFFPSYLYMEQVIREWALPPRAADVPDGERSARRTRLPSVLDRVLEHKLVYIETPDIVETTLALESYKAACDAGRGAVFLSVARGKVAEGVDFDRHYGRAVLLLGVPFQYTKSRPLTARLEYLADTCQINEADFITFDAIRQAAQCAGRVIRGKTDYGLIVFADARYNRADKRNKLPQWIKQHLTEAHLNLSTDMAGHISRKFLKRMAQPVADDDNLAVALGPEDLNDPIKVHDAVSKTVVS